MPDQPLLYPAFFYALHNFVGAFVLLKAGNDFDPALLFIRSEEGKMLQDVEQARGMQQVRQFFADLRQAQALGQGIVFVFEPPGRPVFERTADGAVVQFLAFGGKAQYVGHKQLGYAVLVHLMNLVRAIEPAHGRPDRRFGFAYHHGNAVDEQHDVGNLGFAVVNAVLVGDYIAIVAEVLKIQQAHGHMAVVLAKGQGLLSAEPFEELFVGFDQPYLIDGQEHGPEFIDHLIGERGVPGDFRVEADEGGLEFCFYQHFIDSA